MSLWPEMDYFLSVAASKPPPERSADPDTFPPKNKSADVVGSPSNIRRYVFHHFHNSSMGTAMNFGPSSWRIDFPS